MVPNGQLVAVTKENRLQYIDLVARWVVQHSQAWIIAYGTAQPLLSLSSPSYKLNSQIKLQCGAFQRGLTDIIEPRWLKGFDSLELLMLVGGVDTEVRLL